MIKRSLFGIVIGLLFLPLAIADQPDGVRQLSDSSYEQGAPVEFSFVTTSGDLRVVLNRERNGLAANIDLSVDGAVIDWIDMSLSKDAAIEITTGYGLTLDGNLNEAGVAPAAAASTQPSAAAHDLVEVNSGTVNCHAFSQSPSTTALRDALFEIAGEIRGGDALSARRSAELRDLTRVLAAPLTVPAHVGRCTDPQLTPHNGICGTAGSFEACTACCQNIQNLICDTLGAGGGGSSICHAIFDIQFLGNSCTMQCQDLPWGDGDGNITCISSNGCAGTCSPPGGSCGDNPSYVATSSNSCGSRTCCVLRLCEEHNM